MLPHIGCRSGRVGIGSTDDAPGNHMFQTTNVRDEGRPSLP